MKIRRTTLMAIAVLAGALLAPGASRGATTATPTNGQPLYQFVETGTEPLPWNAVSLESELNSTTMLGGPHGATSATGGVLAYRTNDDQLAALTLTASGTTSWLNYTSGNDVPPPGADPVPFFDPSGNVDLLYVDESGDLILLTPNDPATALDARLYYDTPWRPYIATDLSALTGVPAAKGLASAQVAGTTGTIAYLAANGNIEVLTLSWVPGQAVPVYGQNDATVTSASVPPSTATTTTTTKSTTTSTTKSTTTTLPPVGPTAFASDPLVLPGPTPSFAATLGDGDLVVFASGASLGSWTNENVTALTNGAPVSGSLSLGTSPSEIALAGLTSGGSVELFTTGYFTAAAQVTHALPATPGVWIAQDLTSLATGAPPLSGQLSVQVTLTQIAVAGQAANWGDLFVLTSLTGSSTWSATDVSVTAGSSARTVGNIVTGLGINGQLTLYAAGVNAPPPQGVGVYAIPSAKWTQAITDGWPIISETGGLGTRSAPWVGFTSAASVAASPDFLMGQAIYNSHKRVTWLSFWTVSGPLAGQPLTTANYYTHGYDAGVWVATQIDTYRSLGVGLKPDWVIFDPEGYPNNHSGLDAPSGASNATLALYATYWTAMLSGWQQGIASVDPSLHAGVYAEQSEYRNYQLSSLDMPAFIALAFTGPGPVPVPGASGTNVRGFISFGAACTPEAKLESEASTLLNPPWGGQFNTLQFNPGVYCAPP